jgi:hypothetical protein
MLAVRGGLGRELHPTVTTLVKRHRGLIGFKFGCAGIAPILGRRCGWRWLVRRGGAGHLKFRPIEKFQAFRRGKLSPEFLYFFAFDTGITTFAAISTTGFAVAVMSLAVRTRPCEVASARAALKTSARCASGVPRMSDAEALDDCREKTVKETRAAAESPVLRASAKALCRS